MISDIEFANNQINLATNNLKDFIFNLDNFLLELDNFSDSNLKIKRIFHTMSKSLDFSEFKESVLTNNLTNNPKELLNVCDLISLVNKHLNKSINTSDIYDKALESEDFNLSLFYRLNSLKMFQRGYDALNFEFLEYYVNSKYYKENILKDFTLSYTGKSNFIFDLKFKEKNNFIENLYNEIKNTDCVISSEALKLICSSSEEFRILSNKKPNELSTKMLLLTLEALPYNSNSKELLFELIRRKDLKDYFKYIKLRMANNYSYKLYYEIESYIKNNETEMYEYEEFYKSKFDATKLNIIATTNKADRFIYSSMLTGILHLVKDKQFIFKVLNVIGYDKYTEACISKVDFSRDELLDILNNFQYDVSLVSLIAEKIDPTLTIFI